jgi:predicted Zn-dependent protease
MMRAKLAGYLERPQVVFNRYPQSDTSLPARYGRAIARFMQSGLRAALPEVDALIKERPDNPYFWELKADFLVRSGQQREAIVPLRHALRLSGEANLIRVQLAQALLATQDAAVVGEAVDLLRKSLIEDENQGAYRSLGDAYYRQGKQAEANAAIAQAYFLEGDVKQAQIFAKRAQAGLRQGTPAWIKMDDIIRYKPDSELHN